MSVLINLLPDLRLQRQKDKQRRQLVTGISSLIVVVSVGFLVFMFVITSGQSILINQTKNQISDKKSQLTKMDELIPAYSAQARINSLSNLYQDRNMITKLVAALSQISPTSMQISAFKYDSVNRTLEISGTVQNYNDAAKLDKALESAEKIISGGNSNAQPYFTNVILRSTVHGANGKGVDFSLSANVSPDTIHEGTSNAK